MEKMVKYKIKNGQMFTGQMKSESGKKKSTMIPHGKGTMTYDDGCVIEGVWKNGQIVEGTQIFTNGDRYQGQFKDGKPNGQGKLRQTDSVTYDGRWVNGAIVTGTETQPNGEVYKGNFHNRKRHGQGECYVDNKCIYNGLWEFGAIKEGV